MTGLPVDRYLADRGAESGQITGSRRASLDALAAGVAERLRARGAVDVVFICTHNSRRSHMGQVWAQAAARRAGLTGVTTWSGGTEATAFDRRAVAALVRAGFSIEVVEPGDNPVYAVRGAGGPPMRCWSKTIDDPANPREDFVAVMTCSSADEACPVVSGAALRAPITYEDPKAFDGTEGEAAAYAERCAQIAREMVYLFGAVAARP